MMKNNYLKLFVALLLWVCLTGIQAQTTKELPDNKKVKVTYVGNAGFLINIGDKKILIDALFKGFKGNYNLPQKIQDKLTLAQAPFDNVDLILVTHAHADHVNSDMVRQHLKNNPKAIFASTQQMVNILNGFKDRCIPFNPTKEKSESKVINGISIETFYLPHGPNSKTINIGFLVSVNGVTFFQTGDADFEQFTFEKFRALQLPEKKIDLLFIQHYYLRGGSLGKKFINEGIGGNYIIPIHYHFTNPSFDRAIVLENYPESIIFKKELESWCIPDKKGKFPILKGDYLGRPLPGDTPVVFAPGIVSTHHLEHSAPRFSPDGTEVFWERVRRPIIKGVNGKMIMTMQRSGNRWSRPTITKDFPVFFTNGKRFYFSPLPKPTKKTINTARQNNSKNQKNTIHLLAQYPELKYTRGLSVADNRNIYFMSHLEGPLNGIGIYRAEYINGEYTKPKPLPRSINKKGFLNWTPFIAPDESYLIFSSNCQGEGKDWGDLYISFRLADKTWTNPVNLGKPVNSPGQERFPMVSQDGKYLFFTRPTAKNHQDVFWVSAKVIDKLRNKNKFKKNKSDKLTKGDLL